MKREIEFTKMQGAGNDYIYVNASRFKIENPSELAVKLSKPHTGIGSDGLILIDKSEKADFSMRIFNADGSEAMMCGNGSRSGGKYVYEYGLTKKSRITLETKSGIKTLNLNISSGKVKSVSVDMGTPTILNLYNDVVPFINRQITVNDVTMSGTAVSMGNPHLVFFVDDVENTDVSMLGSLFECHPWFPDRTNVEFAQIISHNEIRMRVWERGSGITMACGTGACATLVAANACKLCGTNANIILDGGILNIEIDSSNGTVIMTGPAETVFEGKIKI